MPFWPLVAFATAIGILGGLATTWLLATVNTGLHDDNGITVSLFSQFAVLCVLSIGGTAISGVINSVIGQRVIADLRKDISARILRAPITALETHRSHRILSVLTADVDTISAFTFNFSAYAIAFAITVGSFTYLLSLSPIIFSMAIVSLVLGVVINGMSRRVWIRDYQEVRAAQDELHRQYRAIIEGAKELKISRPRRERVFAFLLSKAADRIAALKGRAMKLHWMAEAGGSGVFFVTIAVLMAYRSQLGINADVISGAVIVLLYVKGPVEQIASALPIFDQARISLSRIAALSSDLDEHEPNLPLVPDKAMSIDQKPIGSIELKDVTFAFPPTAGAPSFALGPINLVVRGGELLFVVGENGSGKTTLIKLLLGLYPPHSGSLLLNGSMITAEARDDYRQIFSTIFADYHLFDDLAYSTLSKEAEPHLQRLGIAHKVALSGDHFTTTDLSTGQRKRLALVQALLEHRPVIVTDEWAADQDPVFRRVFYTQLIPELKRKGKTVIVISHDDAYFECADRLVQVANGRLIDVSSEALKEGLFAGRSGSAVAE